MIDNSSRIGSSMRLISSSQLVKSKLIERSISARLKSRTGRLTSLFSKRAPLTEIQEVNYAERPCEKHYHQ